MQHIGVDIIEIARIEEAVGRWGKSFLQRVYTESELRLYHKKPSSLAARFAGKEAVIKTLGPGPSWKDIEILSEPDGRPSVHLYGRAQNQARDLGLHSLAISLSHCREYAIAMVVAETK